MTSLLLTETDTRTVDGHREGRGGIARLDPLEIESRGDQLPWYSYLGITRALSSGLRGTEGRRKGGGGGGCASLAAQYYLTSGPEGLLRQVLSLRHRRACAKLLLNGQGSLTVSR